MNLDFTPTFTPALLLKDFHLGGEAARAMDVPMPISTATQDTQAPGALLERYGRMLLIRHFENEINRLFLRGEVHGTTHLSAGQEAVPVGVCMALERGDYAAGTYRGHGHALAKGTDAEGMVAEMLGRATGTFSGSSFRDEARASSSRSAMKSVSS